MEDKFIKYFNSELNEIFDSGHQILEALPKLVKSTDSEELKNFFNTQIKETELQMDRLRKVFNLLNVTEQPIPCPTMKSMIKEALDTIKTYPKSSLRDAALISKAQRIEHYEIAVYGALRTYAKLLELDDISKLLQENLNEVGIANKDLMTLAEGALFVKGINQKALL